MTELLLDEVPSRDLPSQMGIAQLTQVLMLQAFAIALCKGAHLHVLKTYGQSKSYAQAAINTNSQQNDLIKS